MTDKKVKTLKSLSDENVTSEPTLGRRSFMLGTIGGTTALAACVPVVVPVSGPGGTGITDSDSFDSIGNGSGGPRTTGLTDSDSFDAIGNGSGGPRTTGFTDRDSFNAGGNGNGIDARR